MVVKQYDERHGQFRNINKENKDVLRLLSVQQDHVIADIGTGTGEFAIQAAKNCKKVYAIDVSKTMLEYAEKKARENNLSNIVFYQGILAQYLCTKNK